MRRGAALILLAAALAGCGNEGAEDRGGTVGPEEAGTTPLTGQAGEGQQRKEIRVTETEYRITPRKLTVGRAGSYTFRIENAGKELHALEVEGNGFEERSENIEPGQTELLTVELSPGTYEVYCPIGDHEHHGMRATLTVGRG